MTTHTARPLWKRLTRSALPLITGTLLASLVGCSEDDSSPTGPGAVGGGGGFDAVIETGGDFEQVTPQTTVLAEVSEPEPGPDGTFWVCTETTYDFLGAPPEYASFNPNDNIVYPGNLLQGATLASDSPDPIVVRRAGGVISIDLLNGSSGVRQEVDEMSRSRVREAANAILAENTGVVPARFTVDTYKIQSREEMAAKLGVNVSTLTSDFNARMSFEQDTRFNRVIVILNQTFYSMDYDDPVDDADVFAPDVTAGDLDPFIGPGNPAAYISSVAYGRRFYILVESTQTSTEIEAAISASYNAAAVGGSIDAEATYVRDLSEVRIKVHAMGGDQALALNTFNGDFGAVRDFLTQGADFRTGVPLVYAMRALKDKRSIAVKVATTYTVRDCVPIEDSIENPIVWFDTAYGLGLTRSPSTNVDFVHSWTSKFPSGIMATPTNAPVCGFYGPEWINGDEGAVYFGVGNSSVGQESGQLKYDGRGFEGSDYTVFVVYRPTSGTGIYHLSWGASQNANEHVALGLDGDTGEIFMSHGPGQTVRGPVTSRSDRWYVYTFRFSTTEGMSIYENDRRIAHDPSLTQPVSFFPEAQIGSADATFTPQSAPVHLGQFKAYGTAVNDGQRRAQIINWINRFNL